MCVLADMNELAVGFDTKETTAILERKQKHRTYATIQLSGFIRNKITS